MPDFEQAKRAALTQIDNLTGATVEYKIASLEATQALLSPKSTTEQGNARKKLENARKGMNEAYYRVGDVLKAYGFKDQALDLAAQDIMETVNEEATRLVARRLGPEKMKSLGLDADGKPLVGEDVQRRNPSPTAGTPNHPSKSRGTDTPPR
jgi:hypothetical protein